MAQSDWFHHYAARFNTVEINNSFYRLPAPKVFDQWQAQAPPDFLYAVKASRYLTHLKRLKDPAEPLEKFLSHARHLGHTLGPILYQLPPRWKPNLQRLADFASMLPADLCHVVEFRDARWFIDSVREVLAQHRISFCVCDMPGLYCPQWITGSIVYLRFHGSTAMYAGRYSREELVHWAEFIRSQLADDKDVFAYFNNDAAGNAIVNAQELRDLVGK
ncbi:MAG: DUF72 domain-containing protein [Chloroflexi bacterium]|nr:DUF72 domain-containing protein [Chloroflexota bacterium]